VCADCTKSPRAMWAERCGPSDVGCAPLFSLQLFFLCPTYLPQCLLVPFMTGDLLDKTESKRCKNFRFPLFFFFLFSCLGLAQRLPAENKEGREKMSQRDRAAPPHSTNFSLLCEDVILNLSRAMRSAADLSSNGPKASSNAAGESHVPREGEDGDNAGGGGGASAPCRSLRSLTPCLSARSLYAFPLA
jgi:hypothetical protein